MAQFDESRESSPERLIPMGRVLFGAGLILLVLRGLELTTRMPGLPSFWYVNQPLWIAVGLGLLVLGWRILWRDPTASGQPWQPSISGRRFRSATLYVGDDCHMCDDAAAVLAEYHRWLPIADVVNIRSEPQLLARFKTCIPVVVLDGKIRFRGKVAPALLRRLIEGTPPLSFNEKLTVLR
jgi:hypothetical protein